MLINDNQYLSVIESIKTEISKAQYNAALQVNKELTLLYYHIGGLLTNINLGVISLSTILREI